MEVLLAEHVFAVEVIRRWPDKPIQASRACKESLLTLIHGFDDATDSTARRENVPAVREVPLDLAQLESYDRPANEAHDGLCTRVWHFPCGHVMSPASARRPCT